MKYLKTIDIMETIQNTTKQSGSLEKKLEELKKHDVIIKPIKVKSKKYNLRFPIDGMF